MLSVPQRTSWDLYLNFAVFSYNLTVHSSTGFSPFYLTFGSEARLAPDLIFGIPSTSSHTSTDDGDVSRGSLSFLFDLFKYLATSFNHVRENLKTFHQREKYRYDLGAIDRVFKPGDRVRVRIKSRQNGLSKFQSE